MDRGFKLDHATPAEWVERVERDTLALLSDHAHCELKAAASAQALISKNPARAELVERLTEIALEELAHFKLVLDELRARSGSLAPQRANPYAEDLLASSFTDRRDALLDRLLLSSLIEARSLERFHLLSTHLADRALAEFYRSLMASEAAHQATFVRLAEALFPAQVVRTRLTELRAREGRIVAGLAFAPAVHSGLSPRP